MIPRRRGGTALRVCIGLSVAGFLTCGVTWLVGRSLLRSAECAPLDREDLSIEEMVAIKQRVDDVRRDPSRPLELSGREASFVVREQLRQPAWLGIAGDRLAVELRVPDGSSCYDVSFRGHLHVADGVAEIAPDALVVGRVDLTRLAAARTWEFGHDDVNDEGLKALLQHTIVLDIAEGQVAILLDDPEALR